MELRKIALFTDGIYPYVIGGMQRHSYYLAKYLAQKKIRVHLYHFSKSVKYDVTVLEFFSPEEKEFITSFVIPFPHEDTFPGHYLRASYVYSSLLFNQFKKNMDVDFVYAKGFTGWRLLKEKSNGFQFPPVGVKLHGYEMFQKANGLKSVLEQILLLRGAARFNMTNADFLFSYGGKISDIILKNGISHKKIIAVPTAIEESWVSSVRHSVNSVVKFAFAGRYEKRKGIDDLNNVLKKMLTKMNFEFHFIGPIPENKKLKSEKIFYHGEISDSEKIKSVLQRCDVLVSPSYSEGMPNVILEAMACGLAIIATDVGAVNLMVNSENGWLINAGETNELKNAMKDAVAENGGKLLARQNNSILKVRHSFLWKDVINQTVNSIESAINKVNS